MAIIQKSVDSVKYQDILDEDLSTMRELYPEDVEVHSMILLSTHPEFKLISRLLSFLFDDFSQPILHIFDQFFINLGLISPFIPNSELFSLKH